MTMTPTTSATKSTSMATPVKDGGGDVAIAHDGKDVGEEWVRIPRFFPVLPIDDDDDDENDRELANGASKRHPSRDSTRSSSSSSLKSNIPSPFSFDPASILAFLLGGSKSSTPTIEECKVRLARIGSESKRLRSCTTAPRTGRCDRRVDGERRGSRTNDGSIKSSKNDTKSERCWKRRWWRACGWRARKGSSSSYRNWNRSAQWGGMMVGRGARRAE